MEFIGNCLAVFLGIILVIGAICWMCGSPVGVVLILFSSFFLWFSFSDKRYPPIR